MRVPLACAITALLLTSVMGPAWGVAVARKAGLINGKRIKKGTISGDRLKPDTLTGRRIKESSLGKVPAASAADTAGLAVAAGNAQKLGGHELVPISRRIAQGQDVTLGTLGAITLTGSCASDGKLTLSVRSTGDGTLHRSAITADGSTYNFDDLHAGQPLVFVDGLATIQFGEFQAAVGGRVISSQYTATLGAGTDACAVTGLLMA